MNFVSKFTYFILGALTACGIIYIINALQGTVI